MRSVVEGTLLACGKTRVWSQAQERKANQVMARGIRRCLGLDKLNMREFSYSDESLRGSARWDTFSDLLHRNILRWVGHVARMSCIRLAKQALFGWPEGLEEHRSGRSTFPMWIQWVPGRHGIPVMDWFRLAQKPTRNWLKLVNQALPRPRLSVKQTLAINAWSPGDPIPDWATPAASAAPSQGVAQQSLQCPVLFVQS